MLRCRGSPARIPGASFPSDRAADSRSSADAVQAAGLELPSVAKKKKTLAGPDLGQGVRPETKGSMLLPVLHCTVDKDARGWAAARISNSGFLDSQDFALAREGGEGDQWPALGVLQHPCLASGCHPCICDATLDPCAGREAELAGCPSCGPSETTEDRDSLQGPRCL